MQDRPGTDHTLKLVSHDSYKELFWGKKVRHYNVVLVHISLE